MSVAPVEPVVDTRGRPLRDLRLSVTDRCNLRCRYCMPEQDYVWLPRSDVLSFEEMRRLVDVFVSLGVRSIRITGGEPLLRRDVAELVRLIADGPEIDDLAMTTNGVMLAGQARALREAGLHRVTVSLDTLRHERFEQLTQRSGHAEVLAGLRALPTVGFTGTKIDTVVVRGVNDDELVDLLDFARTVPAEIRFIEYMDVGGATRWDPASVVSRDEILELLGRRLGAIAADPRQGSAPARRFTLDDGTAFGIVASTTQPFCASCDRSRLTADGIWYRCLYARTGTDLRTPLRDGAGDDELRAIVATAWRSRDDQGAQDRLASRKRGAVPGVVPVALLRRDPHLEMHTRGG